jgi:hypothetical protein
VSPAEVDSVAAYIERQEEHHRAVSFEEEYRKFLQEYGVEYDERYAGIDGWHAPSGLAVMEGLF